MCVAHAVPMRAMSSKRRVQKLSAPMNDSCPASCSTSSSQLSTGEVGPTASIVYKGCELMDGTLRHAMCMNSSLIDELPLSTDSKCLSQQCRCGLMCDESHCTSS
jgi:hypothetical protein